MNNTNGAHREYSESSEKMRKEIGQRPENQGYLQLVQSQKFILVRGRDYFREKKKLWVNIYFKHEKKSQITNLKSWHMETEENL